MELTVRARTLLGWNGIQQGNSMRKLTTLAIAAMASIAFAAPAAATVINLDGVNNASMDGHNAVSQLLDAGTYSITFVDGGFTAFSRWTASSGCDALGQNCRQGWENSAVFYMGTDLGNAYFLGDGNAHGGYGPVAGNGHFDTAQHSFTHSSMYAQLFTLAIATEVSFFIADDNLNDNRGGVSLSVDRLAVPEPAPLPFLLAGLGIMGLLLRLRQRKSSF